MAAPIQPGDRIADKYTVQAVLGEGGMGVVLAAVDTQLDRQVAIKVLSTENARNAQSLERFVQEARTAAKLENEHAVTIYDVGRLPDGSPYIIMELLRGADLSQVLELEGRLQVQDAVAFVIEACDAVAEAHRHGIIHRDLKPANLFLARLPDGTSRIKVVDFGISKMTAPGEQSLSLTQTSLVLGSPVYMSPEQLRCPKDVDSRTDIWALGAILHELLTGKPPFFADSITALTAKVLLESLPPPDPEVRLPKHLDAVLRKALTKDRSLRYTTIAELVRALAPFAPVRSRELVERITRMNQLSSSTQMGLRAEPDPALPAPVRLFGKTPVSWGHSVVGAPGSTRRRRLLWAAAASLVLGGLGVLLALSGKPNGHRDSSAGVIAATAAHAAPGQSLADSKPRNDSRPSSPSADEPEATLDAGADPADSQAIALPNEPARPKPVVSSWRPRRTSTPKPTPKKITGWESYGDRK